MKTNAANIQIIEALKYFIEYAQEHKTVFCSSEKVFTRNRQLPFPKLVLMIINLNKRTLSVELENFFKVIEEREKCCGKSAFCKQRQHLKYEFFWAWNQMLVKSFYQFYGDNIKRWKGYRIIAVDGSTEYLINEREVIDYFGVQPNQSTAISMGRVMNRFDVLNGISLDQRLLPIRHSEQEVAMSWVEQIEEDMIHLYDRGYPSFASFWLHSKGYEKVKHAVWRCRKNFNKQIAAFVKSKKQSKIITLRPTEEAIEQLHKMGYKLSEHDKVQIRLIKVKLSSGETEVLATTLLDKQKFPCGVFKELYEMRWGIETEYGAWKNIYQLEQFSGRKVETILQDFFATAFIANLHQLIMKDGDEVVTEVNGRRELDYKINRNVTCGLLKNEVVKLFLSEQPHIILEHLKKLFCKYLEPVRKERHYPRRKKYKRLKGKYQTLTNYKRVA